MDVRHDHVRGRRRIRRPRQSSNQDRHEQTKAALQLHPCHSLPYAFLRRFPGASQMGPVRARAFLQQVLDQLPVGRKTLANGLIPASYGRVARALGQARWRRAPQPFRGGGSIFLAAPDLWTASGQHSVRFVEPAALRPLRGQSLRRRPGPSQDQQPERQQRGTGGLGHDCGSAVEGEPVTSTPQHEVHVDPPELVKAGDRKYIGPSL